MLSAGSEAGSHIQPRDIRYPDRSEADRIRCLMGRMRIHPVRSKRHSAGLVTAGCLLLCPAPASAESFGHALNAGCMCRAVLPGGIGTECIAYRAFTLEPSLRRLFQSASRSSRFDSLRFTSLFHHMPSSQNRCAFLREMLQNIDIWLGRGFAAGSSAVSALIGLATLADFPLLFCSVCSWGLAGSSVVDTSGGSRS